MRKLLYILLLFGSLVQAQFTPLVGIVASSGGGTALDYSVLNATASGNNLDITALASGNGLSFRNYGGYSYLLCSTTYSIHKFSEWTTDLSAVTSQSENFTLSNTSQDFWINPAGTLIVYFSNTTTFRWRTMSTPWDVSTCGALTTQALPAGSSLTTPRGFTANADGSRYWVTGNTGDVVAEFSNSTAGDFTTGSYVGEFSTAGVGAAQPKGLAISPDGKYIIVGDSTDDDIYEWVLTTLGTISGGTTYNGALLNVGAASQQGLHYSNDGTKIAIADNALNPGVIEFNLNN